MAFKDVRQCINKVKYFDNQGVPLHDDRPMWIFLIVSVFYIPGVHGIALPDVKYCVGRASRRMTLNIADHANVNFCIYWWAIYSHINCKNNNRRVSFHIRIMSWKTRYKILQVSSSSDMKIFHAENDITITLV